MATRKTFRFNGPQAKTRKLNDQQDAEAVIVAVADGAVEESTPPIFNLIDDCCYVIFDFLSRQDLCSFGQTCKWAQQVAADFYKMNYSSAMINLYHDVDVFDLENAQKLKMDGIYLDPYHQIKKHCNQSVKKIHLKCTTISVTKVRCLKKILRTVEHVTLERCKINGDVDDNILKFCENLKILRLQYCYSNKENDLIGIDNAWLTRKYPTLEHLEITSYGVQKLNELKTFFIENPNVRNFATNSKFLLENLGMFKTGTKLDTLAIRFDGNDLTVVRNNLNALHERGAFQRLHWYANRASDQITSLNGLEKLVIHSWDADESINIAPLLVNIKELSIKWIVDGSNMETMTRNLVNLERVYLHNPTPDGFLSFICHSAKLKKIKIDYFSGKEQWTVLLDALKLAAWNKEREKLDRARKVTIYVLEHVYLAKKWAANRIDFSLIDLKRQNSYDWNEDFDDYF